MDDWPGDMAEYRFEERIAELEADNALLRSEIDQLRAGAWISVADRLPEIPADAPDYARYVDVLCAFKGRGVGEMRYCQPSGRKGQMKPRWEESAGRRLAYSQPTHWMPMPAPPTT